MVDNTPAKKPPRYWETSDFWKDALERIVSSFVFGIVTTATVDNLTNAELSWQQVILAGGVMGALSAIKALVGSKMNSTTPTGIL